MDCYYNRINKLAGINNSILKKSETNSPEYNFWGDCCGLRQQSGVKNAMEKCLENYLSYRINKRGKHTIMFWKILLRSG